MTEFLVSGTGIYLLTAALLAVGCVGLLLFSLRESGKKRRIIAVGAVPTASMSVSYVFMGFEWLTVTTAGREQSVMRFVGYTFVVLAFVYIIKESVKVNRRRYVVLFFVLVLMPWTALASWLTEGSAQTAVAATTVLWYFLGAYYLFFPVSPDEVSDEGSLLYVRLRSIFLLCWGALILASMASEQTLGLLDSFSGPVISSYTDLILLVGIGALVVLSKETFDDSGEVRAGSFEAREGTTEASGITDGGGDV